MSTCLVLAVLGFLIYDGLRSPGTPPDIVVEVDSIGPAGPGYLVQLHARNRGHTTAANVLVQGELRGDTGSVERSQTTIDYVPAGGIRRAGLFFARDPRSTDLRLRAQGYDLP